MAEKHDGQLAEEEYGPRDTAGAMNHSPDAAVRRTEALDKEQMTPSSLSERDSVAEPSAPAEVAISEKNMRLKRSRTKISLIMLSLCLAVFLAALDTTIIATALPTISAHFHSASGYTWIGSSYLLATAASAPMWGKLSDIFGRRPAILAGNVFFLIGSLVAALSTSIGMLITARAIQGIGGGGLVVLVNIIIGDLFSQRERGAYYGIIGGVWALASSLGPIVGGAFTQKVTWRWCFYINLPFDGIALIIIFFFLDLETPKTPLIDGLKAIDWVGALLIIGGTLMFLFGLEYGGQEAPWDSAEVLCLLIFGGVAIVLFGLWEWKFAKYPIIPMRIFRHRSNLAALGVDFCHGMVFIAGSYYLPLYFQAVLGKTPILSGVYLLPTSLGLSVGSIFTGIVIRKTGHYRWPIYVGFFLMTLGNGLYIDLSSTSGLGMIIPFQILAGLGAGPIFQAPLIALQSMVAPQDIATATATFGFLRTLSTAISIVVGGVIFQNLMDMKATYLAQQLGPATAARLGGANAGANVGVVEALPPAQRAIARAVFADSLHYIWILYACLAGLGLVISLFIGRKVLERDHTETKTGLEAQEENRLAAKKVDEERRAKKKSRKESVDVEAQIENKVLDKEIS